MPDPTPAPAREKGASFVIVRSYPKIVYLYLTWLASIVCWLLQPTQFDAAENIGRSATLGQIWLGLFTLNLLVIAFDFSRIRSVALVFFLIAFVFVGRDFGFLGDLLAFLKGIEAVMSKHFYLTVATVFSIIYLLVFINTRFSYWEIQPNEILHHHGFLGDVHRYPTRGLRLKKEITDVLEHILLRSGTLVMMPVGVERPIVLENVIGLNKVEDKIQRLLGTTKVRIDDGAIGSHDS
ncbi:MAG: hypothetical protein O7C98_02515 [Planctomycetota bacterium]|nr:hypothetical protein [Planctomycetota bacterium]